MSGRYGRRAMGLQLDAIGAVVVVFILVAAAMPLAWSYYNGARYSKARAEVAALAGAISQYRYEMGSFPPNNNFEVLTQAGGGNALYSQYGPWIHKKSRTDPWADPWGRTYVFRRSGNEFMVVSRGRNGTLETSLGDSGPGGDDVAFLSYVSVNN